MSGVLKSIGKVFRKVVKVAKKVLPYALMAAAVVFTGGAALGLTPTFGAAVGGLTSSLGLTGALGTAVTGAITNAGFGAAVGGLVGGKKGMQMGALAGAVSGGLMGPIGGAGAGATTAASGPVVGASKSAGLLGPAGSTLGSAASVAPSAIAPAAVTAGTTVGGGGLLGNPLVTSNIISGLGQGMMAKAQASEARKEREQIAANYDLGADPFGSGGANQDQYATDASLKWAYDPKQGKLVRKDGGTTTWA